MKKIILLSLAMMFAMSSLFSQSPTEPAVKPDTAACYLYVNLNNANSQPYTFKMEVDGKPVANVTNGTRLVYRITSRGKKTLSDHGHKPFFEFEAQPGKSYYIDLTKKFAGKYFHIKEYRTPDEIDSYMHFLFWNRIIAGAYSKGFTPDTKTKDYRFTLSINENEK